VSILLRERAERRGARPVKFNELWRDLAEKPSLRPKAWGAAKSEPEALKRRWHRIPERIRIAAFADCQ